MAFYGDEHQTENRGEWKYWLEVLRDIFTDREPTDDLRGSEFANAIVDRFREGYVLKDKTVGQWFATLEAAERTEDSTPGEFEARFLLSHEQHTVPENVWAEPVHRAVRVTRDYSEPIRPPREALILFFSFSDLLPVHQNLKLFTECAISRLKNLKKHPLERELEMGGAARAD